MNLFDFSGRVVIVTGASSGLGAQAAIAFAEHGASVVLAARRKEKLEALEQEINQKEQGQAYALACDVASEEQVASMVQQVKEKYGKVDVLINNAGIAIGGGVDTLTDEAWDHIIDINVKGVARVSKHVVPLMKEAGYGRIINVASINALLADKSQSLWRHAYNTTKAAVLGLTKGMAASYTQFGITTNAVCPGLFPSEMTEDTLFKATEFLNMYNALCPAARPAKKDELNSTFLYFASEGSAYVSGQEIVVDGGFSIV
ncbi:MAG: SDR family NAD(P)-dependent oxidoreductase [Lachnospiraceae bacterium]